MITPVHAAEHSIGVEGGGRVDPGVLAAVVRRRSLAFRSRLAPEVLAARTLRRRALALPDELAHGDLERWVARTMREIVATEDRRRLGHVSRRSTDDDAHASGLAESLALLLTDVRAPSLAARRRVVARRVFALLSGPERDVTYALAVGWTAADVARRLGVTDQTVEVIHLRALRRLDQRMAPLLQEDLRRAVRRP